MEEERHSDEVSPLNRRARIWRTVLLIAILGSVLVGGPLGLLLYIAGLLNSLAIFGSAVPLFMLTPIAILALLIHGFSHRHDLTQGQRWTRVLITAACAACWIPVLLGFCGIRFEGAGGMHLHGVGRYAQMKADIPAIQAWLATLDPNDCDHERLGRESPPGQTPSEFAPKSIPWPPCLAGLRDANAMLLLDDAGRPMIQLMLGGGGFLGHWGITVGNPGMDLEAQNALGSGWMGQRKRLVSGAYAWFQD